ncbi:MAG: amidohydrolase family protein [Pseudomonadota bacterium]
MTNNTPRELLFALLAVLVTCPLSAATPTPDRLLVHCGNLIDGLSDEARPSTTLLIEAGRFRVIGSEVATRPDARTLDLSNYTCLPGLIEMHTHIMEGPDELTDLTLVFDDTHEETMANGRRFARLTLESGVTTARDLGSYYGWAARDLRDEIARGETSGPRLLVAGFYLTIPGGGGDLLAPNIRESDIPRHMRLGVARSPDDFAQRAQAAVDGGADVVKVIASGAVLAYGGIPGSPEMTPNALSAAIEVAHAAGLKVAAHAHGAQSIVEAIEAGADTIEHATYIDEEGIRLALEHDVALSMDIGPGDWMIEEGRKQGWVPEFLEKTIATTQVQRDSFRRAHEAGVPIVFGTDAGIYPHGMAGIQFKFMVEYGMTPMEAIQAATSVAARYLGWEDRVGAIEVGRYGDLIAVRGNPLEDIRLLEQVDVVVKEGEIFKHPAP